MGVASVDMKKQEVPEEKNAEREKNVNLRTE